MMKYVFALIFVATCRCDDSPLVTTPLGKIRGTTQITDEGNKYSAFEGIPYAKPPFGERRFEVPEPVEPWSGVWEANFRSTCAQTGLGDVKVANQTDEDCLHLHVYVPRDKPNSKENLDVIVHFYGGAYMFGNADYLFNPQFFMDRELIAVTLNYRVGILGFLSTEDDIVPGNMGLKDQVLALKWIHDNIASFGGNPNSVTLIGESAGGSSVHMHYFSDMSKGLFHRGIAQSGSALNPWSIQKEPLANAKILAKAVGCPTATNKKMVQCLKERPYNHLLAQINLFYGYNFLPIAPFAPVVEKGSKPFLAEDPYVLLTQGKVHDLPLIMSTGAIEGYVFLGFLNLSQNNEINEKWTEIAPFFLEYDKTLPRNSRETVAKKVKEYYLNGQDVSQENKLQLAKMGGDRLFALGAEVGCRKQAKVNKSPVYYYLFNYPGDGESKIVTHCSDHKYFYGNTYLSNEPLSINELKMRDVFLDMLVAYIKTGIPKIKGVNWEPTGHDKFTYLNISGFEPETIKLHTVEELTPITFWHSLGFMEDENLISTKDEL